ncbi:hypothetical protein [Promineifilum sp.]|uniref:hypothetical protein n=1 Tax=Promineifilum sp. TaxID=2664178 RepID=UPI0035B1B4DC
MTDSPITALTATLDEILRPIVTEPYQHTPAQLIAHGVQHMQQDRENFDRHMAYLLFDIGIESTIKTFLLLHKSESGAATGTGTQKDIANSESFFAKAEAVHKAAPDRFGAEDLRASKHFHSIRNKLYHDGAGIIPTHLADFATFALKVLKNLLAVDLESFMQAPFRAAQEKAAEEAALTAKAKQVKQSADEVERTVEEIIAVLAPRLLYPRYWKEFYDDVLR